MREAALRGQSSERHMVKRVSALAGLTVTATLSGLIREAVIAFSLGTTATADALAIGIFIADVINTLFLTGGVGFAFVPVIKRVRLSRGDDDARALVAALITRVAVAAIGVTVAGLLLFPAAFRSLGQSLPPTQAVHVALVLRGAIVSVAIMAVASALGAALYGFENFVAAACARLGWNAAVVLSLLLLSRLEIAQRASVALVAASLVAGVITITAMRLRDGRPRWRWDHPELRNVMTGAAPGILAVLIGNLLLGFWERTLLARVGEGSIAIVNYAQRASYMASTLSLAVHTVAFNEIVSALHSGGAQRVRAVVESVLRRTLLLLAPLVAIMITARQPIMALLYERGAFGSQSVQRTAGVFGLYALDVMGVFVFGILLRVLYATERPWAATVPTVVMALVAGASDWLLIRAIGLHAIPIGYGIGILAGICTALVQIRAHLRVQLTPAIVRSTLVSSLLASAGAAVVVLIVRLQSLRGAGFGWELSGHGVQHSLILGALILGETLIVAAVALLCGRLWRMREVSELLADLRSWRGATEQGAT